jgi:hypoxanthine phosphoribosyltransferase
MDKIIFSKHAKEQMLRRGITREIVMLVISHPEETLANEEDVTVTIYQSLIKEDNQRFLLRVFINKDKFPHEIITLYKTSKIEKYYEGKIR